MPAGGLASYLEEAEAEARGVLRAAVAEVERGGRARAGLKAARMEQERQKGGRAFAQAVIRRQRLEQVRNRSQSSLLSALCSLRPAHCALLSALCFLSSLVSEPWLDRVTVQDHPGARVMVDLNLRTLVKAQAAQKKLRKVPQIP